MDYSSWIIEKFPQTAYFWLAGFFVLVFSLRVIFITFGNNKYKKDISEIKEKKKLMITIIIILTLYFLGYFIAPLILDWIWNYSNDDMPDYTQESKTVLDSYRDQIYNKY